MWRLPADGTWILLSRRRRLFGFIDHWPSVEICFVAIGLLERAKRMSQCRVSKSMIVAIQREGKRRRVACMKATSCC